MSSLNHQSQTEASSSLVQIPSRQQDSWQIQINPSVDIILALAVLIGVLAQLIKVLVPLSKPIIISISQNSLLAQQQCLTETAAEIQQLLEQLSQAGSIDTKAGKIAVAAETIKHIESNLSLQQRVLSALKAGGTSALEQLLNHPTASFVIAALEDWQKTR